MKFLKEFKDFISRGNVLDLAVAFIIGGAFKTIISSLVSHVIMPALSILIGPDGFDNYKYVIVEADELNGIVENAIYWGIFLQNVVDFFIIAFAVFLIVHSFNKLQERRNKLDVVEEVHAVEVKPTVEELLTDIKKILEQK
mgnify:FL=1